METVYKFWLWRLILGAVFGAIILIAYPFGLGRPAAPRRRSVRLRTW